MNLNTKFLYYFINGDIFFKDITNIERITPIEDKYANELINGNPPEDLLDNNILKVLISNNMQSIDYKIIEYNAKKILFINTWCNSKTLIHIDYDIQSAFNVYQNLINNLNSNYNLNLNYTINNYTDLLTNINKYEPSNQLYIDKNLQETIFIFNFKPRSLNYNMNILNYHISELSKSNKIILSRYQQLFENYENIEFADKNYNIYPNPNCKNLIDLWEIASKCKKIILVPSGSCWTFLHKLLLLNKNQLYMFNSIEYCNRLNNNINLLLGENRNLINNY
jgi:hypothetical protein